MVCNSIGFSIPRRGLGYRSVLSRLRDTINERTKLPLGALVATNELYQSILRYYVAHDIFLVPGAPQHERQIREELSWLSNAGTLTPNAEIKSIKQVAVAAARQAVHWFDPRSLRPELFDIRQTYFTRPVPITCTHHTVSYRHALDQTFLPFLMSETLPCDSIVCSSTASRTAISNIFEQVASRLPVRGRQYKGRFDVIPFGVDTAKFRPIDQRQCRRKFDLPVDATVVLSFGRISAIDKGDLLPLVMAFHRVCQTSTNRRVLLVIAGNSRAGYSDQLKRELRERGLADVVRFIPHVADAEKPFLYGAADVFVSPADSIQECFGLVLLEAMACGVPQIVSDWNGYRELVVHGDTGVLVPTMWADCDEIIIKDGTAYPQEWEAEHFQLGQSVCVDPGALYDGLLNLTTNADLRRSMSAASRRRAEALFDWTRIVQRYEELWEELDQIALTLSDLHPDCRSYRIPGYFSCFKHYPTINITNDSVLVWNDPHGNGECASVALPYRELFDRCESVADWNLTTIAQIIRATRSGVSVCKVMEEAAGYGDRAELMRQVMWLLKYGYIRVAVISLGSGPDSTLVTGRQLGA
jgi:D-inositol-3-phosphate glycosyltransferase